MNPVILTRTLHFITHTIIHVTIYFRLKCNLLSSHPSSTLHVSVFYDPHQVSSVLLKLLHCMSKFRIECERDIT
jgi:hypothetical protein